MCDWIERMFMANQNERGGSMVPPRQKFQPFFLIAAINLDDCSRRQPRDNVLCRAFRRARIEADNLASVNFLRKFGHRMPIRKQHYDGLAKRFRYSHFIRGPT